MDQPRIDQHHFILKVNEIYHDIESEEYHYRHPEIFKDETKRWREIGQKYFNSINSISSVTVLDVGTGTGFVPFAIAPFLRKDDKIICSDLSAKMLNICRRNIAEKEFKCRFEFMRLTGSSFPLEGNSVDMVTMNSVLHHVPNITKFFSQINVLLKKGGLIAIVHEPSSLCYRNRFLRTNGMFFEWLFNLPYKSCSFLVLTLRKMGLLSKVKPLLGRDTGGSHIDIAKLVNDRLLEEHLVERSLSGDEIAKLVDYHSPTAGKSVRSERGFDIDRLLKNELDNYEIVRFETYNHLGRVTNKNLFTKSYSQILAKLFPNKGATFCIVLRKIKEENG